MSVSQQIYEFHKKRRVAYILMTHTCTYILGVMVSVCFVHASIFQCYQLAVLPNLHRSAPTDARGNYHSEPQTDLRKMRIFSGLHNAMYVNKAARYPQSL
jgi:hypothetical protein